MMRLLEQPLAIVDLETTGAHPLHDRVTEIAVLEVAGGEVASEWSTLVNPQTAIPPAIQALTGITNEMVADAPTFEDLAEGLRERLEGRVFVAHNARFDYGFLRREFGRSGVKFQARTLCTVKLSRRLYPEHVRHNLDSVIARHGLECRARHRALGDAQAVWQFLRVAAEERGAEALAAAAQCIARQPALPAHVEPALLDAVPEAPGVYLLYGEGQAPLYIGKSVAMRSRVMQHFSDDLRSPRERELARDVRRIEWQRTCGELGALLKESSLVKQLAPAFNRQLKAARELCGFVLEAGRLRLAQSDEIRGETLTQVHGVFRSRRAALEALRGLADEHRLCLQTLGFEPARRAGGPCFRHQVARCGGVCAGRETAQAHFARAAAALARLKTLAWPWRGPIGVIETDAERDATEVQVVHNWCWLGTAATDAEIAELVTGAPRARFDLDVYRILARHLGSGRAKVVDLQPARA
jgi:DNA polymerase-3 subunit epsilon